MSFHEDIAEFFVKYVEAFAQQDAEALSELWDTVGL